MYTQYIFTLLERTNKSEPVFKYIINVSNIFIYKWNKQYGSLLLSIFSAAWNTLMLV